MNVSAPLLPRFSVIERFALIVDGLCRAVAARGAGRAAPGLPLLAGSLVVLIVGGLRRILARVSRCAAMVEAGKAMPVRPARVDTRRRAPVYRLPRGFAWLVRAVGFEAAGSGSQLQHLLSDPEMAALLEAAPRLRGMLRPLARMLAVDSPALRPVVSVAVTERKSAETACPSLPAVGAAAVCDTPPVVEKPL